MNITQHRMMGPELILDGRDTGDIELTGSLEGIILIKRQITISRAMIVVVDPSKPKLQPMFDEDLFDDQNIKIMWQIMNQRFGSLQPWSGGGGWRIFSLMRIV